jgi:hypothetical protein
MNGWDMGWDMGWDNGQLNPTNKELWQIKANQARIIHISYIFPF